MLTTPVISLPTAINASCEFVSARDEAAPQRSLVAPVRYIAGVSLRESRLKAPQLVKLWIQAA